LNGGVVEMKKTIVCVALVAALLASSESSAAEPSTLSMTDERTRLARAVAQNEEWPAEEVAAVEIELESGAATVEPEGRYDSRGKRDPFRSFTWEQMALQQTQDLTGSPLERFDIGQLSLVAVVWKTGGSRALLQGPSGMNYIVTPGSKVGKNKGRVTEIGDNLVVVRETYVDFAGAETTKEIEMRLRGSQGG
jgi:Tfp pilus assembly protein PilP